MLNDYLSHVAEREALGIPPLPLDAKQTQVLTELLEKPNKEAKPVIKEIPGSGLNKQIAMLIINTKTESDGTNRLILLS